MVRCPKCNNEYNEQLSKCPICGYSPQEDVEKLLEETKSLYSDDQTVIHSDNDMQYHDGFDSPMSQQDAPTDTDNVPNPEDAAPVSPGNDGYQDGFRAPVDPDRVPEKLKEYNVDVNTAYKKQRKIPLGVKIVIAVLAVLIVLTAALFITGVFKIDNGSFVFRPENLPGVTSQAPTDADGNPVSSGSSNTSSQAPTDANGNPVQSQTGDDSSTGNSSDTSGNASGSSSTSGSSSAISGNPNSSKPSSSPSSDGNSSSSGSSSSSGGDTTGTATINGKEYQVGDTVTYTAYLGGLSKAVCGVDASVNYNSSILTIDEDSISFPNIGNPIYNTKERDEFLFNSTNLDGFDFASEAVLVSVSFTVKAAGTSDISLSIRDLIDFDTKKLTGDLRETVSKS